MPPIEEAAAWANGGPVSPADLAGHPTLVHFWAVSCHSCHEVMPLVVEWRERYGPQGLRVVGIHQPRCDEDADVDAAVRAVAAYGLKHPVAVDSHCHIVDAWENKFVPAFYVFDHEGKLRHYQAGDRGQKMVQQAIERVLATAGSRSGT